MSYSALHNVQQIYIELVRDREIYIYRYIWELNFHYLHCGIFSSNVDNLALELLILAFS